VKMRRRKIRLPSLEEIIKWLWKSANLFIEDCVRVLEWLLKKF